jgi:hypothetical protein
MNARQRPQFQVAVQLADNPYGVVQTFYFQVGAHVFSHVDFGAVFQQLAYSFTQVFVTGKQDVYRLPGSQRPQADTHRFYQVQQALFGPAIGAPNDKNEVGLFGDEGGQVFFFVLLLIQAEAVHRFRVSAGQYTTAAGQANFVKQAYERCRQGVGGAANGGKLVYARTILPGGGDEFALGGHEGAAGNGF